MSSLRPLKEKVQDEIIASVVDKKKQDKKKAVDEKLKKLEGNQKYKQLKSDYKAKINGFVTQIAQLIFDNWKSELIEKNKLRKKNPPPTQEEWDKFKNDIKQKHADSVEELYNSIAAPEVNEYAFQVSEIFPKKDISTADEKGYILSKAYGMAQKSIKIVIKSVKTQMRDFSKEFDTNEQMNKIQEKIADIPLKVEEVIDKIQGILDGLLGKALNAADPDKPNFDINVLLKQLEVLLNPIVASVSPLEILGKFPVLGEMVGVVQMLSQASKPSQLTSAQLKEYTKNHLPPQLDSTFLNKLESIGKDVMMVMTTIPIMLINIIFQMINTIYSKLKIITSVIPLGSFFPLNLLPAAITLTPMLPAFVTCFPAIMRQTIMGIIRQKLAEMQCLAFPKIGLGDFPERPLIEEISEDEPKETEKPKEETYKSVTEDFYNKMKEKKYTKTQIEDILKQYCKINDGSNSKIKGFFETNDGVGSIDVTREEQSLDNYKKLIDALKGQTNLDKELTYQAIYDTEEIAGIFFETYKKQLLEKYGNQIVIQKVVTPANRICKTN